ncbi:MAG TPA: hypothetical protein VEY12_06705 [Thermoplasmata archaeon]|nr:hypothetical protein [Thermoplasmata archaeon]
MAEAHDRKTRLNIGVPRSLLPWFETTRREHPGIWKSNGELVLDVLRLGMRAYHGGARPPPTRARREAGAGYLTVSVPVDLASWFDAALAAQAEAAKSRRDLILDVLRLGMQVFEAAGSRGTASAAGPPPDEELPVPPGLIRQIQKLLADHPLLLAECGYGGPADFVDRAIRGDVQATGDRSVNPSWATAALAGLPRSPLAHSGPKGTVVVTREAVRALRAFIEGDPALAREMEYAAPADLVEQAIQQTIGADLDVAAEIEWDAAHPEEAQARDAWWRTEDEARARGDTARLAELAQEQARARAEGRPPWQKVSPQVRAAKAPGAKYAPGT